MLILSRKCNEKIMIGEGIVITVVAIRGSSVRLGVEAPASVPVHRREVYDALQQKRDGKAINDSAERT